MAGTCQEYSFFHFWQLWAIKHVYILPEVCLRAGAFQGDHPRKHAYPICPRGISEDHPHVHSCQVCPRIDVFQDCRHMDGFLRMLYYRYRHYSLLCGTTKMVKIIVLVLFCFVFVLTFIHLESIRRKHKVLRISSKCNTRIQVDA